MAGKDSLPTAANCPVRSRSGEKVLVKAPALHDGREMGALFLEQAEIAERIAVHHEQVCEGPGRDHAELALLAQDASTDGRGRLDHLERLHHLAADQELAALLDLKLPQEIAAVRDGHARALADLERAVAVVDDEIVL